MKCFVLLSLAALVVCQAIAAPTTAEEVAPIPESEAVAESVVREQRSYGAAPSYAAPAPAYAAPLGPAKSYTYNSPAPSIPCGQALVLSCAPSVAQAPCAASAPSYGGGY